MYKIHVYVGRIKDLNCLMKDESLILKDYGSFKL